MLDHLREGLESFIRTTADVDCGDGYVTLTLLGWATLNTLAVCGAFASSIETTKDNSPITAPTLAPTLVPFILSMLSLTLATNLIVTCLFMFSFLEPFSRAETTSIIQP